MIIVLLVRHVTAVTVTISKKIRDIGKYRLRARAGWYSVLIGESNVAIVPAIGGYGVEDIYLGEFSPH